MSGAWFCEQERLFILRRSKCGRLYEFEPQTLYFFFFAFDNSNSILRVFDLMMEKEPTLDLTYSLIVLKVLNATYVFSVFDLNIQLLNHHRARFVRIAVVSR